MPPNDEPTNKSPGASGPAPGTPSADAEGTTDSSTTDLSGRELTMQTPTGKPATADLSGRELTMQTPTGKPATADLSGRELTMQTPTGTSAKPFTGGLSGRELTMQTPTAGISGRELTMQTPSGKPPTADLSGRELTMQTPSGKPPTADLSGRELTIQGGATPTPATMVGGKPRTDHGFKPKTGVGTSMSFDDAWHLQGRKGPFTGQSWGDFDLGGILGEGGMGAVYRGKQKSLRRRVAIKVLPPNLAADTRLLSRFQLEATTTSKMQTPHVVQVYSIGEHEGNHFYAMEYVEGKDLYDVIKERREANKPLTTDEAANYIIQAAKGLAEAGRQGVVHRDIKPPNLMVTKDGLVKIADFGIVKVLSEHNLTMTGQAVGTPAYVSPEQGRGDKEVDPRSDLYSLGVVFYELVCDKKPFDGTTPNALIYQHCYEEPTLPREINPAISEEIQAVIMRCLQKKAENRYQSADELVRDLEAIKAGSMLKSAIANYKLGTGADEAKREQMTWLQRNMLPVAAAALLVIGGIGAGGWWYLDKQSQEREKAALAAGVGEKTIAEKKGILGKSLDVVAPIPDGISARIEELAKLAKDGDQDSDVMRWRAKLVAVRALEQKLAPIESGTPTVERRKAARLDLDAYVGQVSAADPKAERWSTVLKSLEDEEQRLRTECAKLDITSLKKGTYDQFMPLIDSLAKLTPADDAQLVKWKAQLATFDNKLSALLERIKPLEAETKITVAKKKLYAPIVDELEVYIDASDKSLQGWKTRLSEASTAVEKLRKTITDTVKAQPERISKPQQDRIKDSLDSYEGLVGADDDDLKTWKAAIANADKAIIGIRGRLKAFVDESEGTLPYGVWQVFEAQLKDLNDLIYSGNKEAQDWERLLIKSRDELTALTKDCTVLEATSVADVTKAAQNDLAPKVERLFTKGMINAERAAAYRMRLATEAKRIESLRAGLIAFDQAESISESMETMLARLVIDAGIDDPDVKRWSAKRAKVNSLRDKLRALDDRAGVPADVDLLFTELQTLVGEKDAKLVSWQGQVARIKEARVGLRVLNRDSIATYDADKAKQQLDVLKTLVGDRDRQWLAWSGKAAEVALLKTELAKLATTITQSPEAQAIAQAQLRRLTIGLVGADDPEVRVAALRQDELDGPPKPAWASNVGRDQYGLWAEANLPGCAQRFRYLASGNVTVGSPDDELGREADELPVRMQLPRGFWIAETELPRAAWIAVMGTDSSRTGASDLSQQPVERATWSEAQEFCAKLANQTSGMVARLPLEAEWEYACRAGATSAWDINANNDVTMDADGIGKLAWHEGNADGGPHVSRSRLPNKLGLFDMHGNLAEWCADAYAPYPTAQTTVTGPATGGDRRVLRGGSWGDSWIKTRAANRIPGRTDLRSAFVGMRLVLELDATAWSPNAERAIARAQQNSGNAAIEFGVAGWRVKLIPDGTKTAGGIGK